MKRDVKSTHSVVILRSLLSLTARGTYPRPGKGGANQQQRVQQESAPDVVDPESYIKVIIVSVIKYILIGYEHPCFTN